jgi:hypothetical protein
LWKLSTERFGAKDVEDDKNGKEEKQRRQLNEALDAVSSPARLVVE